MGLAGVAELRAWGVRPSKEKSSKDTLWAVGLSLAVLTAIDRFTKGFC